MVCVIKFGEELADRTAVIRQRRGRTWATVAVLSALVTPGGAVSAASSKKATAPVDPVTMGSVQIVNALSTDGLVTLTVDGRVRARGVPPLAATSPLAVSAGTHRIAVSVASRGANDATATRRAPAPAPIALVLDVAPGARRTAFLSGAAAAPQLVVVDTPEGEPGPKATLRVLDLRPVSKRTVVRVDGVVRPTAATGMGEPFVMSSRPDIEVAGGIAGLLPTFRPDDGPTYVFVAEGLERAVVGSVRHNLVGLDSLRTPAPVIVRQRQSLLRLLAAIALVIAATAGAISSMLVFRGRTREDRVRGLMAKSFGL